MSAQLATVDISSLFDPQSSAQDRAHCREALHHALRELDFLARRRKSLVDDLDLRGMDRDAPAEALGPRRAARGR